MEGETGESDINAVFAFLGLLVFDCGGDGAAGGLLDLVFVVAGVDFVVVVGGG